MKITNLLPQKEQQEIQSQRVLSYLRTFNIWTIASYIVVAGALIGWRLYMQQNLSSLDTDIAKQRTILSKSDNTIIRKEVDMNNGLVIDYNQLVKKNPHWSTVLEAFAKLVPAGVQIRSLTANTQSGQIEISGASLTRDAVLQLRVNILNSPMFKNIDLPFENLQKPQNLPFHYTFFVADGVLTQ